MILLRSGKPSNEKTVSDLRLPRETESDEGLLSRLLQYGDRDALGVLYDRYERLVRSIARRILGDASETEDFVEGVFLFLLNKSECFDPDKGSVGVWLAKEVYRRLLARRRLLALRKCPRLSFGKPSEEEAVSDLQLLGQKVSDECLLLRIQYGNRDALGILYNRYERLVRSMGRRVLCDADETEDLVADVFLALFEQSRCFDPSKGSVHAWLSTVTHRRALDRRRYLTRRGFYGTGSGEDSHADLTERTTSNGIQPAELSYWRAYLRRVLARLPDRQRSVLKLHFYAELTINEISDRMDESPANIRNHYYRGLESLKGIMSKREVGDLSSSQDIPSAESVGPAWGDGWNSGPLAVGTPVESLRRRALESFEHRPAEL